MVVERMVKSGQGGRGPVNTYEEEDEEAQSSERDLSLAPRQPPSASSSCTFLPVIKIALLL